MRIGLDCRCVFKGMGGIGRYAWCLLKEFSRLDQVNEYVCYFTHLEPPEALNFGPRFRMRSFEAGMIDERFDQLVLPGVLEEDRIDLYHNMTFAVPVVRTRARMLTTVHDVVFKRHPDLVEPKLRKYLDKATVRACRSADQIITVSQYSKDEIVRLYPIENKRVTVIPNGVHQPPEQVGSPEESAQRISSFGLKPGAYVLYVGSIEEKKNISVLLKAFHELLSQEPAINLRLALTGSRGGPDYPLESRIRDLGIENHVVVPGYVSNEVLEALYQHAAIFVYPSLYEGFGLPPLEAMARGIPTIVSDASSLPEVVGDDAVLFDPTRSDKLARAIVDLVRDSERRKDLAERGKKRARQFSWNRSARQHLELYAAVMKSHENTSSRV